jgi:hypothetical protein
MLGRRLVFILAVLPLALLAGCPGTPPPLRLPDGSATQGTAWGTTEPQDAGTELASLLARGDTDAVRANFTCTKTIVGLDKPLINRGTVFAAAAGTRRTQVRWSTRAPYTSDIILRPDRVLSRAQCEQEWDTVHPSGKPGLTTLLAQLGAWLRGQPETFGNLYRVTAQSGSVGPRVFILTPAPNQKDLLRSVARIELELDPPMLVVGLGGGTLTRATIVTPVGDRIEYRFTDVERHARLAASSFDPTDVAPTTGP